MQTFKSKCSTLMGSRRGPVPKAADSCASTCGRKVRHGPCAAWVSAILILFGLAALPMRGAAQGGWPLAWGDSTFGQVGDGSAAARITPVQCLMRTTQSVAVGGYHSLALKTDGTVWAWGNDNYGQLGDGSNVDRNVPVMVAGLNGIVTVAAGDFHSLALKPDGTVWAWGSNYFGQLGNGNTTDQSSPVAVSGLTDVVAIAAGYNHSLAVKSDGTVWAWGNNDYGQLGDGTTTSRTTPVMVSGLTGVVAVAAGTNHSLALKSDGTVWAFGYNAFGQLGDGTTTNRTAPVAVSGMSGVAQVAAGRFHSLAVKMDGTVWSWGNNGAGQLGDGTTVNRTSPVQVAALSDMTSVAAGSYHSIALKSDGTVWSWGDNQYGQLGDGTLAGRNMPAMVSGLGGVARIGAGGLHNLTVKTDRTVWGWGWNIYGEIGDGGVLTRANPVAVAGLSAITGVASGSQHNLAVKADGTVWAWGYNEYGQLGDGTMTDRSVPVVVPGMSTATAVAAGASHSLAVKADGSVWAWGDNEYGQLGDDTTVGRLTPAAVSGLSGVTAVAAGSMHSLALKTDGTVWAWGANLYGQLGDTTTTSRATPGIVANLTGVVAVAGGGFHSLALKSDGTVWAWGRNDYGQLGDGTTTDRLSPVMVSGLSGVVAIAAGYRHSLAVKSDGTVWAWGGNGYGQLGDYTTTNRLTPVMVAEVSGAVGVAAGDWHSLAVKADGSVWAWGRNSEGQLGDGTTTSRGTPAIIPGLNGIIAVAAGSSHSLAVSSIRTARIEVQRITAQRGSTATLVADLMSLDEGMVGRQLGFYFNGSFAGSAVTNASGRASVAASIPSGLQPGFYPIQVAFSGASDLLSCSGTGWLEVTISRQTTSLTVLDRTGVVGQTVPLSALLRRTSDNTGLAGRTVTFDIEGTEVGSAVTNASGRADLNWVVTRGAASRTIHGAFAGDADYLPASGTATFTTNPLTPYIFVADRSVNVGMTTSLYAYFRTLPGYVEQPGKTVTFKVDGTVVSSVVTDAHGVAQQPYDTHGMTLGSHTIRCEFAGDDEIAAGYGEAPLTILGAAPYIWVAERSVNVGMTASLHAYFRTLPDKTPQAGKTVTFKIDGTAVANVVTDSGGIARSPYDTHGMTKGAHTIRCDFAGDADIVAGYGEAPLTILPAKSYLWVADRTVNVGFAASLYGYLRTQPDLTPQAGKTITFRIDGTVVATVQTDTNGVARYAYDTHGMAQGTHAIRGEYAGDAETTSASADAKLTILPMMPYIWVASRSVNVGYVAGLYAYFRTLPDYLIQPNKTVTFKIDGTAVGNAVTDSGGIARYNYDTHGVSIGTHTIRCDFAGDSEVAAGYGEAPLRVLPAKPYVFVADKSVNAGLTVSLYAYFRTLPDLIPQNLKGLTFKIDGKAVGTSITGVDGTATLAYDTRGLSIGDHTIRVEFAGDAQVAAGYGEGKLTILPAKPYITVPDRSGTVGSTVQLYAIFLSLPDMVEQPGKNVKFKIDGTQVGTAVTDYIGVARYQYNTTGLSAGNHTITCLFLGDATLAPGSGQGTLTLN